MDTFSLYLVVDQKELTNCLQPGRKTEWEEKRSSDCDKIVGSESRRIFFFEHVAQNKKMCREASE